MDAFMSSALPMFCLAGLWTVWNTEKIEAYMLKDLKVNPSINFKLAVRGHVLSKEICES